MQSYNQQEWNYSQVLWDFQSTSLMYDLYAKNFVNHLSEEVGSELFVAFSYIGSADSKYGSWGHLENLDQLDEDLMTIAPKYQALLDFNIPKN